MFANISAAFPASAPGEDLRTATLAPPRRQRQGPPLGRGGGLQFGESGTAAAPGAADLGDAAGAARAAVAVPQRRWRGPVLPELRANRRCSEVCALDRGAGRQRARGRRAADLGAPAHQDPPPCTILRPERDYRLSSGRRSSHGRMPGPPRPPIGQSGAAMSTRGSATSEAGDGQFNGGRRNRFVTARSFSSSSRAASSRAGCIRHVR